MVTFTLQEEGSQTLPNLSDKRAIQDAVSINIGRVVRAFERKVIKVELCQI